MGAFEHRCSFLIVFGIFAVLSLGLAFFIRRDFFPIVDSGQIRFHVFTPVGKRIEEAELYFARVDSEVRNVIPPHILVRP